MLTLLLCVPLFSSDYYYENDKGFTYDITNLASLYENGANTTVMEQAFNIALASNKDINCPVIKLSCPPTNQLFQEYEDDDDLMSSLRPDEYEQ